MNFWLALSLLIGLVLVLTFLPSILAVSCPSRTFGSNTAHVVKYFSSPLCVPCWYQKAELEKLTAERGDTFLIEEYDADFCASSAAPLRISGTPSFIVNGTALYGFRTAEELAKVIP